MNQDFLLWVPDMLKSPTERRQELSYHQLALYSATLEQPKGRDVWSGCGGTRHPELPCLSVGAGLLGP